MKDYFEMNKEAKEDLPAPAEAVHLTAGHTDKQSTNASKGIEETTSYTTPQIVKNLSVEMFGSLVNQDWGKAEELLLEIVETSLLAHQARQNNAEKIAEAALKAIATYRHYQTL